MTRSEAREFLMKIIFQMESNNDFDSANIINYMKQENNRGQELYISSNLKYLCENREAIDQAINDHSSKWKTTRLAKVDLAILRLAICEFNACEEIPSSVTINESVELSKKYSSEESGSFINGVLGGIINE